MSEQRDSKETQSKIDELNESFKKLERAEAAYREMFGEIPSITDKLEKQK